MTTINEGKEKYYFMIHRTEALTNIQGKPTSCHDDKVKYGIFKGFIHRAKSIYQEECLGEEIKFLLSVFI